ncbi:MAG: YdcF family protein [Silvanigrellaceae bacterium]
MASPIPGPTLIPSEWPLQWVRLAKDFGFDLGAVALLSLLLQWFVRSLPVSRQILLLLPVLLVIFTSTKGMPEFWAKPILARSERLPLEACRNPFSALVVLGGGLAGPDDLAISSQSRVRHAARWMSVLPGARRDGLKIVMSAGPTLEGSTRPEADLMKEAFVAWRHDIAPERVLVEDKSLNTRDNATRVAALLGEKGQGQTVALVTSWLHMSRAVGAFRTVGFTVCPVPSPAVEHTSEGFLNFRNGDRTVRVFNEYVGIVGYRLAGWL